MRLAAALAIALLALSAHAATVQLAPGDYATCAVAPACAPPGTTPPEVPPVIPPAPPITPPAGWSGTCPGFEHTIIIPLDWSAPMRLLSTNYGGFRLGDIAVITFTTGAVSSSNNLPHITVVEYGDSPSQRVATLSATPCFFATNQATPGFGVGNTITSVFAVGSGSGFGFYPVLKTNTTYYLNIKNNPNGGCVASGTCDVSVDLIKAGGL